MKYNINFIFKIYYDCIDKIEIEDKYIQRFYEITLHSAMERCSFVLLNSQNDANYIRMKLENLKEKDNYD